MTTRAKPDEKCGATAQASYGAVHCHALKGHDGCHVSFANGRPAWTWVRGSQRATKVVPR